MVHQTLSLYLKSGFGLCLNLELISKSLLALWTDRVTPKEPVQDKSKKSKSFWYKCDEMNDYVSVSVCHIHPHLRGIQCTALFCVTCAHWHQWVVGTHLSGFPGTISRRRHLLAHWISSSLMRMSLWRAMHQSCPTVVLRFCTRTRSHLRETAVRVTKHGYHT